MMIHTTVIRGTLNPDGTLNLETRPEVPAGPVEVTIRTVRQPLASTENWWEFLQRSRAELQAAGSTFMTEEDVQSHVEDLRSGDERLDTVYRRMEDEPRTVRDADLP
jgi:hypothetical protein